MWRSAGLLALWLSGPALACDFPGPPPGSGEVHAPAGDIRWAVFSDATTRYGHGVLGDRIEAGGLRAQAGELGPCVLAVILPEHSVFEDVAPRITDLDGDGRNEIVVVETHRSRGAALAVYGLRSGKLRKLAATPNIGRTHRWLAPMGAADLDGDGAVEIAYIDRPHLAKTLRIWRYTDGKLEHVADQPGLTNHKIGWDHIPGGIRACDGAPEIIAASADWTRIIAVRFTGGKTATRDIGPYRGPESLNAATRCN